MQLVRLAREAMATRFELALHGQSASALRAAGEEALDEIDRLEALLSLYRPESDIARVNARAARQPVRVSPLTFKLISRAREMQLATAGAFDISIAPLVRCWGFMGGTGHMPDPAEVAQARGAIGMHHVILDPEEFSIRFDREGVMLDLGAIGKGFALDRAAEFLREAGVSSALIHGGTSTVCAIGKPLDDDAWKVVIDFPEEARAFASSPDAKLATLHLTDQTLSVSAVWGRAFQAEGKAFGHVLDPRSGEPVSNAILAAVTLPSATETDALSTALLVLGTAGMETLARFRPDAGTLVVTPRGDRVEVTSKNFK